MAAAAEPEARRIQHVLVVIAMAAEAAPFVAHLGLAPAPALLPGPLPCAVFSGQHSGLTVTVVTCGACPLFGVDSVGTVPAALATYAACAALAPDLVLSAGTAGGFAARGGAVGDVYVSSALRNHDRRIQIPGFDSYGVGELPSPGGALAAALGLKWGVVSTGNSLNCGPEELAELQAAGVHCKEMEAAAVGHVARLFRLPCLAVKAVTDVVDGGRPTAEEFGENLAAAAAALQRTLPRVIAFVAGKTAAEL